MHLENHGKTTVGAFDDYEATRIGAIEAGIVGQDSRLIMNAKNFRIWYRSVHTDSAAFQKLTERNSADNITARQLKPARMPWHRFNLTRHCVKQHRQEIFVGAENVCRGQLLHPNAATFSLNACIAMRGGDGRQLARGRPQLFPTRRCKEERGRDLVISGPDIVNNNQVVPHV